MSSKNIFRKASGFVIVLAITCVATVAQTANRTLDTKIPDSQENVAAQTEDDEKLDDSFRRFGNAAGAAYQCTADAEREKLVSDVRQAYTRIGQLFGTDRAFYFAVHFGNASQAPIDKAKCPELLKKLRESILIRRAAR